MVSRGGEPAASSTVNNSIAVHRRRDGTGVEESGQPQRCSRKNFDVRLKDSNPNSAVGRLDAVEGLPAEEAAPVEDVGDVWLYLPLREQSSEEKARTRQFAREVVELLRNHPR